MAIKKLANSEMNSVEPNELCKAITLIFPIIPCEERFSLYSIVLWGYGALQPLQHVQCCTHHWAPESDWTHGQDHQTLNFDSGWPSSRIGMFKKMAMFLSYWHVQEDHLVIQGLYVRSGFIPVIIIHKTTGGLARPANR